MCPSTFRPFGVFARNAAVISLHLIWFNYRPAKAGTCLLSFQKTLLDAKLGAGKKPCNLCSESWSNARLSNATIFAVLSKHLAFVGVRFLITALSNVRARTHRQALNEVARKSNLATGCQTQQVLHGGRTQTILSIGNDNVLLPSVSALSVQSDGC